MNHKAKKIMTNPRVIILLIILVLAIVAINPRPGLEGAVIKNVISNSSATEAGIQQAAPTTKPVNRERILAIDNKPVKNAEDYYEHTSKLELNQSVQIKTNKGLYRLIVKEKFEVIELNETETKTIEEIVPINESVNGTIAEKLVPFLHRKGDLDKKEGRSPRYVLPGGDGNKIHR